MLERVRREIAQKYCGSSTKIGVILADRILSIKVYKDYTIKDLIERGLIVADDQNVPAYDLPDKALADNQWWSGYATGHIEGKEAMLKAKFRRVIPKEGE